MLSKHALVALLTATTFGFASNAAMANTGQVTHLSGTLSAKKADGSIRILSPRSEITSGDTLMTEKGTYANIRFADGANMTLKPNSAIKIEQMKYDPSKPKEDSFVASLISGGLRMITGLLGRRSRGAFRMETATATIGIRGTTFNVDDCTGGGPGCGDLPQGVYVGVTDGSVEVSNSAGRSIVNVGQYAVIGKDVAPRSTANPGLAFSPPAAFSAPGAQGPKAADCVIRR